MEVGEKIIVAMSGGVDSSVAAYLLKRQGYRPLGVFMCAGLGDAEPGGPQRCCSPKDSADAREVARRLDMPFAVLDFADDFRRLIDRTCEEYGRGRTPNPCVLCNRDLKFGRLFAYASAMGASGVATGHYARVEWEAGRWRLKRGLDRTKDQSYFLFPIPPERLQYVRLPLGEMTKTEVRAIAREAGLPVHDKEESQDICFVRTSIADLVRERRPDLMRPGPILDQQGRTVGRHEGVAAFTIGQRRGLGVAADGPRYVIEIRASDAAIVIGPASALRARGLVAAELVWHEPPTADEAIRAEVQIRYRHAAAPAWITRTRNAERGTRNSGQETNKETTSDNASSASSVAGVPSSEFRVPSLDVMFDEPQPAVTPGQAVVFYHEDRVLGGGWIEASLRE
jgi:tRNA-specific 2-thiouridylase